MKFSNRWTDLPAGALLCAGLLGTATSIAGSSPAVFSLGASDGGAISLEPNVESTAPVLGKDSFANAPANFRSFPSADVGAQTPAQQLSLRFSAATRLTHIDSTRDFQVDEGGSCVLDTLYTAGESCTLQVRFTPQGGGARLGKLTISHTASAAPFTASLGGYGFAPTVSFIPAQISTVAGTYPGGVGLLSNAQNMTVDGGDVVYIADVGNNIIREIDSSGVISSPLNPAIATPASVAVDNFGIIYTLNTPGSTYYFSIWYPWASETAYGYAYTSSTCTAASPCDFAAVGMNNAGSISIDPYNNLFMDERTLGALEMPVGGVSGGSGTLNLWHLSDQFAYLSGSPATFAVDANDNLYTYYNHSTDTCFIVQESLYNAEYSPSFTRVAGGVKCGFSGDGHLARGAEIGSAVGQIAFDLAGNLYFSDTSNQRVRRIDATTGIINTIAGNGKVGYTGDRAAATTAELNSPTGVAVDSQGQVYIISSATTGQVLRKVGPMGYLNFGSVTHGTASPAHILKVSNTGNSTLTINNAVFTGANAGDFSIDPTTTTCPLTAGSTLFSGDTCLVGIILKPSTTGKRLAQFSLLDNTVTGSSLVQLTGTGL
ncbi:MAG: choice-of-anchor D domain-containing protein [Steroidobacteraceae bacterium]